MTAALNPARWSIRWQIAALLITIQIIAHAVTLMTVELSMPRPGGGRVNGVISLSEPMVTALRMGPPGADRTAFDALVEADSRFVLTGAPPVQSGGPAGADVDRAFRAALPAGWQERVRIYPVTPGGMTNPLAFGSFAIAAGLPDGRWLVFRPNSENAVRFIPRTIALFTILLVALPLMLLSVWAGAALVAPIRALALGAERFAGDMHSPALPEKGPVEVRKATQAFNRMRLRVQKLVSDRSQTLASIGHDMRTPLTRLRLRLELIDQGPATAAIQNDLLTLERMIDDALEFLRDENRPLRLAQVDLAVLLHTTADDFADRGHEVSYAGPARLVFCCDHDLIRRVVENVVGNAAKFADSCEVALSGEADGGVRITIRDDGPGIPLGHRDKVLEPFARIDAVRAGTAQDAQGFGLGLAIARDLTERHGGALTLGDNAPRGLLVTIRLPVRDQDDDEGDHG